METGARSRHSVSRTSKVSHTIDVNSVRSGVTKNGEAASTAANNLKKKEDREDKPAVTGVVTFHVKEGRKLHLNPSWQGANQNVYVQISIRGVAKRTQIVEDEWGNPKWDQSKHFPIMVPRDRHHPFNWVKLEVLRFDPAHNTEPRVMGTVSFHVHDIIKASPVDASFDLYDEQQYAGEIMLGVTFHYGIFGYGYSNQMDFGQSVEQNVSHSLYPRVEPPAERTETRSATLIPRAVAHPDFIPFNEKVVIGYGRDLENELRKMKHHQCDVPTLQSRMKKLNMLRFKLQQLGTDDRAAKLAFLQQRMMMTSTQEAIVPEYNTFTHHIPTAISPTSHGQTVDEVVEAHRRPSYLEYLQPARAVDEVLRSLSPLPGEAPSQEETYVRRTVLKEEPSSPFSLPSSKRTSLNSNSELVSVAESEEEKGERTYRRTSTAASANSSSPDTDPRRLQSPRVMDSPLSVDSSGGGESDDSRYIRFNRQLTAPHMHSPSSASSGAAGENRLLLPHPPSASRPSRSNLLSPIRTLSLPSNTTSSKSKFQ